MEYILERQLAVAYGYPTTASKRPRFMVKAGSTAMRGGTPNVKRKDWLTDQLVKQGVLTPHPSNANLWVFKIDHGFSSASAAGDVINDGNLSAPQYWINTSTGKTLKDDLLSLP